jgi:alpha-galactosidase
MVTGMNLTGDLATGWTIRFGGHRFDLALRDGDLRSIYFGNDFDGPASPMTEPNRQNHDVLRLTRPEAAIYVGPRADRIMWSDATARVEGDGVVLRLSGATHPVAMDITFATDSATSSIVRDARLDHLGGASLDVRGALSLSMLIPGPVDGLTYLDGAWAAETQVRHIRPDHTPLLLESRSGKTGFEYHPYLAAHTPDATYIISLLCSSNWQIHARHHDDGLYVSAGLPDSGFQTELREGESLTLPTAILLHAHGDLNAATQAFHTLRRRLQRAGRPLIPVQFNTWYPFPGKPRVDLLLDLLPRARALGAEVFVLDGGWYDNAAAHPDDDPWELTGDWLVHKGMFPNGLEEIADACREQGMDFGIWFEPEGIGYSAALRQQHPEWFHWINGAPPAGRKRGILNFGIDGAREHARDAMLRILQATGARWVKWDFNEDLQRGGWAPGTPVDLARQDPLLAHYRGVYRLQDELHAALPDLVIEMCASGGGRFDGEIMRRAHVNWMSDQWESLKNLSIHFGSQLCHPPEVCNDWLIEWPVRTTPGRHGELADTRGDLLFRLHVAMLGSFGLSAPIANWSDADLATAATEIAWYKSVARPHIQDGRQYILTPSPPLDGNGSWAAMWHAAAAGNGGVALVFRLASVGDTFRLKLDGLDPAAMYDVSIPGQPHRTETGTTLAAGIDVRIDRPYRSLRLTVTQSA